MLTAHRTAGINLARIVQTKMCPSHDPIYCVRDSSILIMAEMTAGILVACVPTFGPLIFRRAHISTRPHDRPTIGSVRIRPRRLSKSDSLLSTVERSHDVPERSNGWNRGPEGGLSSGGLDPSALNDSEHSFDIPSQASETSKV